MVELEHVGFTYRTRYGLGRKTAIEALSDISFHVERGETLGLIGRNGCGKSTLLKLLTGIYRPDRGTITRHCQRIALLALSIGFDPQLSGSDNLILASMLMGFSKREALKNRAEIIEFAGLEDFIDQPLKSYSSGMRARLGFAIGIKMRADLLLVDEVLGVGDASFRARAQDAMIDLIKSDQSVVFVSHSLTNVNDLCQRVVWLEDGMIRETGEAEVVTRHYSEFMASASGVGNQSKRDRALPA
jgi:lipopolysaccharide transport system ATP-binding protein